MSKIDIIVAVHNEQNYLDLFIKSVLKQTFTDWRLILIDDGSKDCSVQICKNFAKNDSRIILVSQDSSGSFIARRKGLDYIKSKYVMFLDADDSFSEKMLENIIIAFKRSNTDAVFFKYNCGAEILPNITLNEGVHYVDDLEKIKKDILLGNISYNQLWNKAWLSDLIKYDSVDYTAVKDAKKGTDWIQLLPFLDKITNFYYIDKPLYNYEIHENSISKINFGVKERINILQIINRWRLIYSRKWNVPVSQIDECDSMRFYSYVINVCMNSTNENLYKKLDIIVESKYYKEYIKNINNSAFRLKFIGYLLQNRCYRTLHYMTKFAKNIKKIKYL